MEVEKALEARRQLGASLVANLGNILAEKKSYTEVELGQSAVSDSGFWRTRTRGRHVLARQRGILINNELQIEFCWLRNLRAFSPLQHTSPGIIIKFSCPSKIDYKIRF